MENTHQTISGDLLFPYFSRLKTGLFFVLLFIILVITNFQGFDLSDEGFLSTFYSHIFDKPESVSYCFMFWLTGIIGGIWEKIFSPMGLFGIRLGSVVVNTLCAIFTYQLLKKYLNPTYLKLGLLIAVLSLNNDIKVLNYNTLSALFYILTVTFIFTGLQKNQTIRIFVGGFLVGLNLFIRVPNLLETGLVLGIFYYGYLFANPWNKMFQQAGGFILGFLAAVCCAILAMYLLGHLAIFEGSLKILFMMSKGAKHPEVEGGYGVSRIISLFRNNLVQSVKFAFIPLAFLTGSLIVANKVGHQLKLAKYLIMLVIYSAVLGVLYLIISHKLDHFDMLFFIIGFTLLSAVSMFTNSVSKEIKIMFFFGCFFVLSFPVGSSDGVWTAGRYCLWIAVPVALDYLLGIRSVNIAISLYQEKNEHQTRFWITEKQLAGIKKIVVLVVLFAGFYHLYFYPFFDRRNRSLMRYALQSDKLKGIYTTKGRAEVFNELISESKKLMKENERIIAYDNIPMFYFATKTIPFTSNPSPGVYTAELFQADLNASVERNGKLPTVVRQIIGTVGEASKWPEESLPEKYSDNERNHDRNLVLDSFLTRNNYREIWSNKAFMILIPGNTQLP